MNLNMPLDEAAKTDLRRLMECLLSQPTGHIGRLPLRTGRIILAAGKDSGNHTIWRYNTVSQIAAELAQIAEELSGKHLTVKQADYMLAQEDQLCMAVLVLCPFSSWRHTDRYGVVYEFL